MKQRISISIFTLSLLAGLLLLESCARNPVTGKKEFMLMSQSQELSLGASSDPQIIAAYGLYDDQNIQNFINQEGQAMVKVSHRSDIKFQFRVLDSPVVNAFAVPGGYVYFTRGILAHFNNEAEFAGVLGHEIGHVAARHSAKQYSQATLAQIGLTVGAVFAPPQFSDFVSAANTGVTLLFLKFSRDHETESDRLGVEYSTRVGYDANEMADFFSTINRLQEQAGAEIPDFLSTHPNPVDRYSKVKGLAVKWQKELGVDKSKLKINRDAYLQMIDGIVYGEDPRQGFFENNFFYHPQMKFYFPVPAGWQTLNAPSMVQMAPENGDALMVLQLAQEKTPSEAAQAFITNNKLTALQSEAATLNGKSAYKVLAEQKQTDANGQVVQTIKVLSYFIKHENLVFHLYGIALDTKYGAYKNFFTSTLGNFKTLTDSEKINRQPDRIKIKSVSSNTTLRTAFNANKVAAGKLEEMAILNGMKLTDQLKAGSKIKVIE